MRDLGVNLNTKDGGLWFSSSPPFPGEERENSLVNKPIQSSEHFFTFEIWKLKDVVPVDFGP